MILGALDLSAQNPAAECPRWIFERQVMVSVRFFTFRMRRSEGIVVIDRELAQDIVDLFDLAETIRFPITSAIPISYPPFFWSDARSMAANNTSAFNFRFIQGTTRLSWHAFGRAIDINPVLNPCVTDGIADPAGAVYDPERWGTLFADSPLVKLLKDRGWRWGGDWTSLKDWQHLDKPFPGIEGNDLARLAFAPGRFY